MHNQNNISSKITADLVRRMLAIDAKEIGANIEEFISENLPSVHLAVNLQAFIIADLAPNLWGRICDILIGLYCQFGFIGVQRELKELLTDLLSSVEASTLEDSVIYPGKFNELLHLVYTDSDSQVQGVANACQILGFLARFTLFEDSSGAASIKKFKATNDGCLAYLKSMRTERIFLQDSFTHTPIVNCNYGRRMRASLGVSSDGPSEFILDGVSWELKKILGKRPRLCEGLVFSHGSVAEGVRTVGDKVDLYSAMYPTFESGLQPSLSTGVPCEGKRGEDYPRLICVPKTLEARRVIAPEPLAKAVLGQTSLKCLRTALERTGAMLFINDKTNPNMDGQIINRMHAMLGSNSLESATIDLSSASDSISRSIFFRICPMSWRGFFVSNLDWEFFPEKGKTHEPLNMLFTSGHPLCWDTEAAYFLAIARFSCRLSNVSNYASKCYAYGDDLIIPSVAYDTTCEILEALGHTVNRNKSYSCGLFRESCGGWYYGGFDITPVFWPRSTVVPEGVGLQPLCKLQHLLVGRGLELASNYLTNAIKREMPDMTTSPIGDECDDLWDLTGKLTFSASERYSHYTLTPKWVVHRSIPMDHFLYYQHLKYGPSYDSKLSELLGVSSSRRRVLYTTTEMKWCKASPLYGSYGKTW